MYKCTFDVDDDSVQEDYTIPDCELPFVPCIGHNIAIGVGHSDTTICAKVSGVEINVYNGSFEFLHISLEDVTVYGPR